MLIREATPQDGKGIAKVLVDVRKIVNRGLVPDSYLESLSYADREKRWALRIENSLKREFTFVAVDETGGVQGFAHVGPPTDPVSDFGAELYEIYVAVDHQRRGLGKSLLHRVARKLKDLGFTSLEVWVLSGNPSRRFYEAMGADLLRSGTRTIGNSECSVVCYGWKSLDGLIRPPKREGCLRAWVGIPK